MGNTATMLKTIVAVAASVLISGGLIAVFSGGSASIPTFGEATELDATSQCSNNAISIKSVSSGYYLKPGTSSGSKARWAWPDGSTPPTWTITASAAAGGEFILQSGSVVGLYLTKDGDYF